MRRRGRAEPRAGRGRGRRLGPTLLSAAVLAAGCGGEGEPRLTVAAASSLKTAFTEHAEAVGDAEPRLAFGGSDQLAAQIRAGARPDVFAAANTELPEQLHREGLAEPPVHFASNRLVVATRADGGPSTIGALAEPGTKIAIGSPSVPVGKYAREALRRLPPGIAANVASEEPDVSSIVARVRSGAVDAGFVYATDVPAVEELRALELPFPTRVEYAAAVVRGTKHPDEARRFVASLRGARALRDAGFAP